MGVSHRPGFGLLGSVPRSLSTQPPFATQALTTINVLFLIMLSYAVARWFFSIVKNPASCDLSNGGSWVFLMRCCFCPYAAPPASSLYLV